MAKLIKGKRTLSDRDKREIFDRIAQAKIKEREKITPKQGQAVYKGIFIRRTPFRRWETPFLRYGDQPGEFHSFKTLKAAKAFIDRR